MPFFLRRKQFSGFMVKEELSRLKAFELGESRNLSIAATKEISLQKLTKNGHVMAKR